MSINNMKAAKVVISHAGEGSRFLKKNEKKKYPLGKMKVATTLK